MRFQTLPEWLQWQERLHPTSIDLGLARVRETWRRLHAEDFACPVITVAGTNGKGSSVAMLQAIYREAGYRVASYTSPHLWRYNERICLDGEPVSDSMICEAFARVDAARQDTSLTYFEFGTLAALDIFKQQQPEVIILEVGLGGRLDAVNIIDADVALITAIDLDHMQWLGADRAAIAREKAGILRSDKPGIVIDPDPPATLIEYARSTSCQLLQIDKDFSFQQAAGSWSWHHNAVHRVGLPMPALAGAHQLHNAAGVMMAVESLQARLPVSLGQIRQGLLSVRLPGRFQIVPGEVNQIFDVAHNPAAARQLAVTLRAANASRVHAVFSALADKDIGGIVAPLCPLVLHWYIAPLHTQRGAMPETLLQAIGSSCPNAQISQHPDLAQASACARQQALPGDHILVFGSFYTVAESCPHGL